MNTDSICKIIPCPVTDDIPSYLGEYSLQSGTTFSNNLIAIPIAGGGYYYVPAGTIVITVPSNAQFISYQGCQSMVSLPVPTDATQQIISGIVSDVMNQIAAQLAVCNTPAIPGSGTTIFSNTQQTGNCAGFPGLEIIGATPPGFIVTPSEIICPAGIFTSEISQADANESALLFIINFIESNVECGWWNEVQTCPNMSIVPANTYFSTVSQADANALAIAGGCPSNNCPDWTTLAFGSPLICVNGNCSVTFTPDSTTGNVISSTGSDIGAGAGHGYAADCSPTPVGFLFQGTPNEGVLTFDSQQDCNCNLHLSITRTGTSITGVQSWIEIYNLINPGYDLQLNFSALATGEYDFPFTISNQSTNSIQEFVDIVTAFSTTGINPCTYNVVATLTSL